MEFPTKYHEDLSFQPTILSENYMNMVLSSTSSLDQESFFKGSPEDNLHFDRFPFNGMSSNSDFGMSVPSLDPSESFACMDSINLDMLDSMPFVGQSGMTSIPNMDYFGCPQIISSEGIAENQSHMLINFQEKAMGSNFGLPDEVSCIIADNRSDKGVREENESNMQMRNFVNDRRISSARGQWTEEEDRKLVGLVKKYGNKHWTYISHGMNGRIGKQCRERWHNHLRPNIKVAWEENESSMQLRNFVNDWKINSARGQWTKEEDRKLVGLVKTYGDKHWTYISHRMNGRIGKQCRERWHNHLRPNIKKETWTEEEDMALIRAHRELGNKWAEIAKRLAGRTENSIKNHWNATKRKQFARRRYQSSKYAGSSNLQNYIKNLGPDAARGPYWRHTFTSHKFLINSAITSVPAPQETFQNSANDQLISYADCGDIGIPPDFTFEMDLSFFDNQSETDDGNMVPLYVNPLAGFQDVNPLGAFQIKQDEGDIGYAMTLHESSAAQV